MFPDKPQNRANSVRIPWKEENANKCDLKEKNLTMDFILACFSKGR